jgi:Domain of unknown function (DUF4111)
VLTPQLTGIYAGGSWALGDYVVGRSDLDVSVVTARGLADDVVTRLIAEVRHEALPCPARGLELVVYTVVVAGSGSSDAGFELNLNSGPAMETRIDRHGQAADGHWFAIDRAILAQRGQALLGPAAAELFAPPPREQLLELLADSIDWYERESDEPADAVLNACRGLRYARTESWTSKEEAALWMLRGARPSTVVAQALAARRGKGEVEESAARDFLESARRQLSLPPL